MNKFTIFTVILAVSVIIVAGDLAARRYFAGDAKTSVIESAPANVSPQVTQPAVTPEDVTAPTVPPAAELPSEYIPPPPSSKITEEFVKQAGFTGDLKERHFDGKLFQLLDITKTPVAGLNMFEISENGTAIASITEINLQDEIRALQSYVLLQNKTKTYIDLSLNETNAYGDRSFYINHAKKPSEAFLVVKINKTLYAFAYVKSYHPQIKNIIQLLTL